MKWTTVDPDHKLHKGNNILLCPEWAVVSDVAAPECESNVDSERLGLERGLLVPLDAVLPRPLMTEKDLGIRR